MFLLRTCDVFRTDSYAGGHRSGLAVENPPDRKETLRIRVFSDGFIINRGPFRSLDDPHNAEFLRTVRSGQVPEELMEIALSSRGEVPMEMNDVGRPFDPNKDVLSPNSKGPDRKSELPHPVTFSGAGTVLGGSSSSACIPQQKTPTALGFPDIHPDKPTTSIQIRMPTGERCVRIFNIDARGIEVAQLISDSINTTVESIVLSAGFPPKPIANIELCSKSVSELGLCGSAINVSFK